MTQLATRSSRRKAEQRDKEETPTTDAAAPSVQQKKAPTPASVRQQRRWKMTAAGIALVAVCGAAGGWIATQQSHARQVVMLRHSVSMGHKITISDLSTTQMTGASGVSLVPADKIKSLVGRYPTSNLPAGSLVTSQMTSGAIGLAPGQQIVAVPVKSGQMPGEGLKAGDPIRLVLGVGNNNTVPKGMNIGQSWDATVTSVGSFNANSQAVVDVAVPDGQSTDVATAASTGNLQIVLTSTGEAN